MTTQFKYSVRSYLTLRLICFAVVVTLNLIFGFMGYYNVYGAGGKITAIVLSSLTLCGIFIASLIADFETVKGLYSSPSGYLIAMTPVKSWKIILSRVVTILVEDLVLFSLGIAGVVWQALNLSGVMTLLGNQNIDFDIVVNVIFAFLIIVLEYFQLLLVIFFCVALSKSVFGGKRAGAVFAVLATLLILYLFSLLNFVMLPFCAYERWFGVVYNISIDFSANTGMFIYLALSICKSMALFSTASFLTERKINL